MPKTFNFSFGVLTQRGDRIISLLDRDKDQFLQFGYDEVFKTNLNSKLTIYRKLPSDNYWLGHQTLKTEAKDNAYVETKNIIQDIRFRSKYALGESSIEYKSLRFNQMKDASASDLILLVTHIATTCREMLDKLSARNITEEMIVSLEAAAEQLDKAIDEQQEMKSTREAKTIERENMANEIYAIIAEICEAGKNIWQGKNQAYYNDYVIYGSRDAIAEDDTTNEVENVMTT